MKKILVIIPMLLFYVCSIGQTKSKNKELGQINWLALIDALPEFPSSCKSALVNGPQLDKYEKLKADLEAQYASIGEGIHSKINVRGVRKANEEAVNQNPIMKEMGGVRNVQNMRQGEAEKQARAAAKKQMRNPNPVATSGMQAFQEDMINNPDLLKRYEKMSEKEKADFLAAYMAGDRMDAQTVQKANTYKDKGTKAKTTMLMTNFLTQMKKKLNAAVDKYRAVEKSVVESGYNEMLAKQYTEAYKKIPLVIMGEGKVPEPKQERALRNAYAVKFRDHANVELGQIKVAVNDLKKSLIQIVSEYQAFVKENRALINDNPADLGNGTNMQVNFYNAEGDFGGTANAIAKIIDKFCAYGQHETAVKEENHSPGAVKIYLWE